MALRNLDRYIHKGWELTMTLRRLITPLSPRLVAPKCSHQLLPRIMAFTPARTLITLEYFKPHSEDLKDKDPTEVLQNLDPDTMRRLKIIQMEYEVLRQMGNPNVPEEMTDAFWLELLQYSTANARKRYYRYLRKCETTRISKERKKQKRLQERQEIEESRGAYEGSKNCIFMFIRRKSMNHFYYSRLAHAMCFGQPIIFDMDFENVMRSRDVIRLLEQFLMAHGSNKVHLDPFHFVLCNHKEDSFFHKAFVGSCDQRDSNEFLFTITDQNYSDIYPHKQLIYLTPDAPNELTTFDHDAVYIIGGLVDKINAKPLTLAKAKRENLKMAKLPLDRYLRWSIGNKSLTLNQMVDILLEMKVSNDWQKALRHVPDRKLTEHKRLKQSQ